jgi:hypothetical protein
MERQGLAVGEAVGRKGSAGLALGFPALALPHPCPLALTVEPAAQLGHALGQTVGAERNADPARLVLGHGPRQRLLGQRTAPRHIEEHDEGLVLPKKALRRGKGERFGAGEAGIVWELHSQPLVDGVELRVKSGDRGADCVRRSGICLADGSQQALVLAMALGDEILALAHQPCQWPRAFGEPHRHLGERIGRARVQGPLRQLKALRARCRRAAAAGTVHSARR